MPISPSAGVSCRMTVGKDTSSPACAAQTTDIREPLRIMYIPNRILIVK